MGNKIVARKQKQNTNYNGEIWVAGKAEPISPRVAASLGEPMLGGQKMDQKRGCPSGRSIGSDGTLAPPSWRDPDLLRRVANIG